MFCVPSLTIIHPALTQYYRGNGEQGIETETETEKETETETETETEKETDTEKEKEKKLTKIKKKMFNKLLDISDELCFF